MLLIDEKTGKTYRVLRFSEIKKNDLYLLPEVEVATAEIDFPDDVGSFILEEVKSRVPPSAVPARGCGAGQAPQSAVDQVPQAPTGRLQAAQILASTASQARR